MLCCWMQLQLGNRASPCSKPRQRYACLFRGWVAELRSTRHLLSINVCAASSPSLYTWNLTFCTLLLLSGWMPFLNLAGMWVRTSQRVCIKHVILYIIPCEGAYLRHRGMKTSVCCWGAGKFIGGFRSDNSWWLMEWQGIEAETDLCFTPALTTRNLLFNH